MPLGVSLNRAETWFKLLLRLTEWVSCIVYGTVYIFKNYSTTIFLTFNNKLNLNRYYFSQCLSRPLFLYALSGVSNESVSHFSFCTCPLFWSVQLLHISVFGQKPLLSFCHHIYFLFFLLYFLWRKIYVWRVNTRLKALILWVLCVLMNHETESNLDNFETRTFDNDQKHMWT